MTWSLQRKFEMNFSQVQLILTTFTKFGFLKYNENKSMYARSFLNMQNFTKVT